MDIENLVSENRVFSALPQTAIQKIISVSISRKYFKGEFVTHEADVWPYLLFVKSGKFQVLKESTSGRVFVIEDFGPGEIFWGLALFEENEPNPATIQTSEDSELLLWHKNQIEEIISQNTSVAWGLFYLLAQKMKRVGAIVEELAFQPLTGRLANLLLDQLEMTVGDVIARDLTLDEMAARIGTTREMVCKILYRFSDKQIIEIQRTELTVKSRKDLREIGGRMKG